ncbi:hypothetical protein JCM8097_001210 [Rhodosporidiobolus ruineniae]
MVRIPHPLDILPLDMHELTVPSARFVQFDPTPSPPSRASLTSLPPELLASIFLPRLSCPCSTSFNPADDPLRLPPQSIAISRALLPFARANAYDSITVAGDRALALLGEMLREKPELGELVRRVEVKEKSARWTRPTPAGEDVEMEEWTPERLEDGAVAALDALTALEEVVVDRAAPEELLTLPLLSSGAFAGPPRVKLIIVGDEPVSFAALRYVSRATGVGEVEVRGKMRMKVEGVEGMFEGFERLEGEGVERLTMESEPHATGFAPLLEQLAPRSLKLHCFTTDAQQVFGVFGPRARAGLERIEFGTSGYFQREIGPAFAVFPSLTHLTLLSPALLLTDAFFASLRSLLLLRVLSLRGPIAGTGKAWETLELVADWIESLAVDGRLERLERVEVDVVKPVGVGSGRRASRPSTPVGDGKEGLCEREEREREVPVSRCELQARRLAAACARLDLQLGGSVLELL